MSEPRVIQADFANWRPVAGRKVLQLILEVPIEQTEQVMKMLGVPMPGETKWCAIALLDPVAQRKEQQASNLSVEGSNPSGTAKDRKPFHTLPLSSQAAIRCQDAEFQVFMDVAGDGSCAAKIREICGVTSRSEFNTNSEAGDKWRNLEAQYQAHLTTKQFADVRR